MTPGQREMTAFDPLYMTWLDYQIARLAGRVRFFPNGRIDRLMSEPEALRLFDKLWRRESPSISSADRGSGK